ncbi:MAG: GGDEF domain-containing protein, partial [Lachnospiraceae bacterium]|nr:GGDEF domain-containing protein [Lachnospiraceae bacterium]
GIKKYAKREDFDIFVFMGHASFGAYENLNRGELNIYRLGDVRDFDGLILFSSMLNSPEMVKEICDQAREYKIPAVSIGMEQEGIPYVTVSNEQGMRQLMTHLIEVHGVKRVAFIGGTADHVDSIARLQVTKTVLEEHGLKLAPEDIQYGDWGNDKPAVIVRRYAETGNMPDALICANDIMALSAMTELSNRGYRLPEDVIVTGFDHIKDGTYFYPALTSVTQNYEQVGYACCERLFEQIRGETPKQHTEIPSRLLIAESCGCKGEVDYEQVRRDYCQSSYQNSLNSYYLEQSERMLRIRISDSGDYDRLRKHLQEHYFYNHLFEGEDFALILNSEYLKDVMSDESELKEIGYGRTMDVLVNMRRGIIRDELQVDQHELVPGYQKIPGQQEVYYFFPLHADQFNYGYSIMGEAKILFDGQVYTYMERIQQALKVLRVNLRLDALNQNLTRLYDKDPMTGLFNRFAYENKAVPLFEESKKNGTSVMVLFVDINYMKRINDQFGHIHGDHAIMTVAESIQANAKENWISVRFGGDEFLVIAPISGETQARVTRQNILEYLEKRNHDGNQPYHISASCGYVITDPDSDLTLQDYIKEADKLMYEIKREVHARDKV